MLLIREIADLMSEMDRAKREATVDALTEDDAKQVLKEVLHTMHRWTDGPPVGV